MNRRDFLQRGSLVIPAPVVLDTRQAQSNEQKWIAAAEALKRELQRTTVNPTSMVRVVADPSKFLQSRVEHLSPATEVSSRLMRHADSAVLDFGRHLTGYLSFAIAGEGRGVDAPTRLKLTFGEVPAEVAEPFDPYTGTQAAHRCKTKTSTSTCCQTLSPCRADMPFDT